MKRLSVRYGTFLGTVQIPLAGAIAHVMGSTEVGGIVYDSIGNATYTPVRPAYLNMDGTTYFTVPAIEITAGTFEFDLTPTTTNNNKIIRASNGTDFITIGFYGTTLKIGICDTDGGNGALCDFALTEDQKHHVKIVWDGTIANTTFEIDGVSKTSTETDLNFTKSTGNELFSTGGAATNALEAKVYAYQETIGGSTYVYNPQSIIKSNNLFSIYMPSLATGRLATQVSAPAIPAYYDDQGVSRLNLLGYTIADGTTHYIDSACTTLYPVSQYIEAGAGFTVSGDALAYEVLSVPTYNVPTTLAEATAILSWQHTAANKASRDSKITSTTYGGWPDIDASKTGASTAGIPENLTNAGSQYTDNDTVAICGFDDSGNYVQVHRVATAWQDNQSNDTLRDAVRLWISNFMVNAEHTDGDATGGFPNITPDYDYVGPYNNQHFNQIMWNDSTNANMFWTLRRMKDELHPFDNGILTAANITTATGMYNRLIATMVDCQMERSGTKTAWPPYSERETHAAYFGRDMEPNCEESHASLGILKCLMSIPLLERSADINNAIDSAIDWFTEVETFDLEYQRYNTPYFFSDPGNHFWYRYYNLDGATWKGAFGKDNGIVYDLTTLPSGRQTGYNWASATYGDDALTYTTVSNPLAGEGGAITPTYVGRVKYNVELVDQSVTPVVPWDTDNFSQIDSPSQIISGHIRLESPGSDYIDTKYNVSLTPSTEYLFVANIYHNDFVRYDNVILRNQEFAVDYTRFNVGETGEKRFLFTTLATIGNPYIWSYTVPTETNGRYAEFDFEIYLASDFDNPLTDPLTTEATWEAGAKGTFNPAYDTIVDYSDTIFDSTDPANLVANEITVPTTGYTVNDQIFIGRLGFSIYGSPQTGQALIDIKTTLGIP